MARKGGGGRGRLLIFHFLFCFLKPKSMVIFSIDCFLTDIAIKLFGSARRRSSCVGRSLAQRYRVVLKRTDRINVMTTPYICCKRIEIFSC